MQKVYVDEAGHIVDVLYSTEPRAAPIAGDQLRIMSQVIFQ